MKDQRYTLHYYDGEELDKNIPNGFDTIQEATQWAKDNNIPCSILRITEWDLDNRDYLGVPEIIASVTLEIAVIEEAQDLSRYQIY
jgi:hypothetical protein